MQYYNKFYYYACVRDLEKKYVMFLSIKTKIVNHFNCAVVISWFISDHWLL